MDPICTRCGLPVKKNKDSYELFEKMHWLCFHLEFEHGEYDPDEGCDDPSCPWNRITHRSEDIINKDVFDINFKSYENNSTIYLKLLEKEMVHLPSILLKISILADYQAKVEDDLWFEVDAITQFISDVRRIFDGYSDTAQLCSMSPNEFYLNIIKIDRTGHFILKYTHISLKYIEKKYFEYGVINGFGVESMTIDRLCEYLKGVCRA